MKLCSVKLNNFVSMQVYVSQIVTLSQQLSDTDRPLDDEFIAATMLAYLTPEYKPMVMAIENSGVQITSDYMKSKLLKEGAISFHESDVDENVILVTKKYVVRCFNCNKVGHKQYDCLNNKTKERKDGNKTEANKKGDNRRELRKKEDKSSSFKRSKGSSRVTALSASRNSDAWYIDSGATTHMTNRKVWLDNYSDCGSKEIRIANGDKLHGFGQGNVVKTSDNSECGVINHVTYVPKLSTNLLSVSTMVRRGV
jgi:hypothetical protein